jgi:hypothetical protein
MGRGGVCADPPDCLIDLIDRPTDWLLHVADILHFSFPTAENTRFFVIAPHLLWRLSLCSI